MATKTKLLNPLPIAAQVSNVAPIRKARHLGKSIQDHKAAAGKDKVPAKRAPQVIQGIGNRLADHIERTDQGGVDILREIISITNPESRYATCDCAMGELMSRRDQLIDTILEAHGKEQVSDLSPSDQKKVASIRSSFARYLVIVRAIGGIKQALGRTTRVAPDSRITADLTLSEMHGFATNWNGHKAGRKANVKPVGIKRLEMMAERLAAGADVDSEDKDAVSTYAAAVEKLFAAVLTIAAPVSNALAFDLGKVLADVKTPRRSGLRRAA